MPNNIVTGLKSLFYIVRRVWEQCSKECCAHDYISHSDYYSDRTYVSIETCTKCGHTNITAHGDKR